MTEQTRCCICDTKINRLERHPFDGLKGHYTCYSCCDYYSILSNATSDNKAADAEWKKQSIKYFRDLLTKHNPSPEVKGMLKEKMQNAFDQVRDIPAFSSESDGKSPNESDVTPEYDQTTTQTEYKSGSTVWTILLKVVAVLSCVVCCIGGFIFSNNLVNRQPGLAFAVFIGGVLIGVLTLAISMLFITMAEDIHAIRMKLTK